MAKPPETPSNSDIDGVNRDARISTPSRTQNPDPGKAIDDAEKESKGRPKGDQ